MSVNVLIIDDDVDINDLILSHLALDKFVCRQAFSGEEGLALARSIHPDVVVLDLMMPGIDGYEVCRKLKAFRSTCDIPVLLLSCLCRDERATEGWLCGAWAQIGKAFEPRDVARQIEEAASWRQRTLQQPVHGEFFIDPANLRSAGRGLSEMICVVVNRTAADDISICQIRDGFMALERSLAAHTGIGGLQVTYTVKPASPLAGEKSAGGALHCTFHPDVATVELLSLPKEQVKMPAEKPDPRGNWLEQFMAATLMLRLDTPGMEGQSDKFLEKSPMEIRVERQFPVNPMIRPADGGILPIRTPASANSSLLK